MSSNIILECSQYKSNSTSNSQWTTTFSEEVLLEEGDVFQLQQCLLNTQTVSSGSINIENDIDVTIQVAYYEMALGTHTVNTIPSGTSHKPTTTYLKNTPLPYATATDKKGNVTDARQTYYNTTFLPVAADDGPSSSAFGLYLLRNPTADGAPPTDKTSGLYTANLTITVLSGVYQPDALATYITKAMEAKFDASVGGGTGEKGLLVNLTDTSFEHHRMVAANTFGVLQPVQLYTHQAQAVVDSSTGAVRMVGASTFQLSFDSGVFSFTNLHSPMMGASGGASGGQQFFTNPSAGLLKTGRPGAELLQKVECFSGCLLTDLQPRAFWASLGFTSNHIDNNIVFNDTIWKTLADTAASTYLDARRVRPTLLMSDFRSNLQTAVFSFDYTIDYNAVTFTNDVGVQLPKEDTMLLIATTDTFTLDGDVNYVVDDIGYFRIEAETVISNNFKQQDKRLGAVVGIVSKNYNANDFVIGYGDGSSIAYQHTGVSQVISAINISVIDPLTNAPVVGMGKNSTVFLEVVKAPPQPKGRRAHQGRGGDPIKKN